MEKKLASTVLAALGACALLVFVACTPVDEPGRTEPDVAQPGTATSPTIPLTPVTEYRETENGEEEISPLPSDLMFVIGETSGEYWIEILTTFDELPCGNFRLVAGVVTGESDGEVVIEIEGIALDGDVCLEAVGPAGARLHLGTPAGKTALRLRYEETEDVYQLTTEPGFLTMEAMKAEFTRAEYKYWRHLPALNFYSPYSGEWEHLEADMLLLYTTTAWNEDDGEALQQATVRSDAVRSDAVRNNAERVFEELIALGARPFSAEGAAYSVLYATPPLEGAPDPTHIVRFLRYDGPLEAVRELLAAHDEVRMRVYSQEGSNVPTQTPGPTRTLFIPTPTATKTPLPPTPTTTPTPSPGPVSIFTSQEVYQEGEPVVFTITNHVSWPIYYRYGGCAWPVPVYVGDNIKIALKVDAPQPNPDIMALQPGETATCMWNGQVYQNPDWGPPDSFIREQELRRCSRDQTAWQEPSKEGRARYEAYDGALDAVQAPPGAYRFLPVYYFADPAGYAGEGERLREEQMVISHPFAVTDFAEAP